MNDNALYLSVTVTNRSYGDEYVEYLESLGAPIVLYALGKGTANQTILDMFGLVSTEKAVLLSLSSEPLTKKIFKGYKQVMHIDLPGNGIALAVPVGSVGGRGVYEYCISHDCEAEELKEDKEIMKQTALELVIVMANEGYSELVMEAAYSVDVRGGTILHAKGTGKEHAEKFFGMSIAEEKEVILIVTSAKKRVPLMKAIMAKAGMRSDAQSLVISLPIDMAVGLPVALLEDAQAE
ncbi:MAG: P-II family nitrogen regulator [Clostridia bacterium]|nr:P-II family nitrogen regulator [Clostridia bacterium]